MTGIRLSAEEQVTEGRIVTKLETTHKRVFNTDIRMNTNSMGPIKGSRGCSAFQQGNTNVKKVVGEVTTR